MTKRASMPGQEAPSAVYHDHCPACGTLVGLLDKGELSGHFPNAASYRPCVGSWKLIPDVITPEQSAVDPRWLAKVRERIEKLLNLGDASKNSEAGEASAARTRAEELMKQHGFTYDSARGLTKT